MIKLQRAEKPDFLTQNEGRLTADFAQDSSKRVWNNQPIKEALLNSSHNKCCFCECKLVEEAKYLEVEHFKNKGKYPTEVVSWDNLLPACKRCNAKKGTHDVVCAPIVNPYNQDPRAHFKMTRYRLVGKDEIGKNSIDVLALNDCDQKLSFKRFEIGNQLTVNLEELLNSYPQTINLSDRRSINRFISKVSGFLIQCQPTSEYASAAASILVKDAHFQKIILKMTADNLWNTELEELLLTAKSIAFDE